MGAPIGNANALKYGWCRDSFEHAFPLTKLPADCQDIDNRCYDLRRRLLEAVFVKNGYLTLALESKVNLAIGYEQGRRFIGRAKEKATKSTLAEKVAAQQYQDDAALRRDKTIASLGLDTSPVTATDPWHALHAPQSAPARVAGMVDPEADQSRENATQAMTTNGVAHAE